MMWRTIVVLFTLAVLSFGANPDLDRTAWPAQWAYPADADPFGYGVYHFRKTFNLDEKPGSFLVHVSADNRYQLFVNGERGGLGPGAGRHIPLAIRIRRHCRVSARGKKCACGRCLE